MEFPAMMNLTSTPGSSWLYLTITVAIESLFQVVIPSGYMIEDLTHGISWNNIYFIYCVLLKVNVELFTFCIFNLYFADVCDPGWSYFNGFCYFTSETCTNWTTALAKCRQENSVLVDVNNNEENVYLQHLHNGEKSWLGLNDISTEGTFSWADRAAGNFTAWAKNQPNNFGEEDCVHALGVEHKYEWNDVKCSDCHQYTCKKGKISKISVSNKQMHEWNWTNE